MKCNLLRLQGLSLRQLVNKLSKLVPLLKSLLSLNLGRKNAKCYNNQRLSIWKKLNLSRLKRLPKIRREQLIAYLIGITIITALILTRDLRVRPELKK